MRQSCLVLEIPALAAVFYVILWLTGFKLHQRKLKAYWAERFKGPRR